VTRVLADTAIFVYAVGAEDDHRRPCQVILERVVNGEIEAFVSADLLQEFVHQRTRRGVQRSEAVRQARRIVEMCAVLSITSADAAAALDLYDDHAALQARDAVFAAVALRNRIDHVLSPDRAFDAVPGLHRVDPLDAAAVEALTR
jgi:predicted nucleic acid-binding protein